MISLTSILLKNLHERKALHSNWPYFQQKDGYIVANADKIFDVLADITVVKDQKSIDQYMSKNANRYKNTPSKISPVYEEEKQEAELSNFRQGNRDDKIFDQMENKHHITKKLNQVNSDNLEIWVELMKKAVKDITVVANKDNTKKTNRLVLEDLYQAFSTILRIRDRASNVSSRGERSNLEDETKDSAEQPTFSRPTLQQLKDKLSNEAESGKTKEEALGDLSNDFYL